jgi:ATP-dependent exoDNAse (exonuclease V) beta subunit
MIIISQSRLNKARECFAQYYFQEIEEIKIPDTIWPGTLLGLIIHKMAEEAIFMKLKGINEREIMKHISTTFRHYFDQEYDRATKEKGGVFKASKGYSEYIFMERGSEMALNLIRNLLVDLRQIPYTNLYPEKNISVQYKENILLDGTLDLVVDLPEWIEIIDYKTTAKMEKFTEKDPRTDFQSIMYTRFAEDLYKKPVKSFTYYVQHSKSTDFIKVPFKRTIQNFAFIERTLTEHMQKVQDGRNGNLEYSPSEDNCRFCKFKKKVCNRGIG